MEHTPAEFRPFAALHTTTLRPLILVAAHADVSAATLAAALSDYTAVDAPADPAYSPTKPHVVVVTAAFADDLSALCSSTIARFPDSAVAVLVRAGDESSRALLRARFWNVAGVMFVGHDDQPHMANAAVAGARAVYLAKRLNVALPPITPARVRLVCTRAVAHGHSRYHVPELGKDCNLGSRGLNKWIAHLGLPSAQRIIARGRCVCAADAIATASLAVCYTTALLGFSQPRTLRRLTWRHLGCAPSYVPDVGGVNHALSLFAEAIEHAMQSHPEEWHREIQRERERERETPLPIDVSGLAGADQRTHSGVGEHTNDLGDNAARMCRLGWDDAAKTELRRRRPAPSTLSIEQPSPHDHLFRGHPEQALAPAPQCGPTKGNCFQKRLDLEGTVTVRHKMPHDVPNLRRETPGNRVCSDRTPTLKRGIHDQAPQLLLQIRGLRVHDLRYDTACRDLSDLSVGRVGDGDDDQQRRRSRSHLRHQAVDRHPSRIARADDQGGCARLLQSRDEVGRTRSERETELLRQRQAQRPSHTLLNNCRHEIPAHLPHHSTTTLVARSTARPLTRSVFPEEPFFSTSNAAASASAFSFRRAPPRPIAAPRVSSRGRFHRLPGLRGNRRDVYHRRRTVPR